MVDGDDKLGRVRALTTAVRKQVLVLMCAVNDRDDDLSTVAAIRIHDALREAQRIAAQSKGFELEAMVEAARLTADPWLARVSRESATMRRLGVRLDANPIVRLEPLESAADLLDLDLNGAVIDHLDIGGLVLTGLRATGARMRIDDARDARLAHCDLTACDLSHSRFDTSMVERSKFDRSNLEGTSWESAQVTSSSFVDATFVDARLDHVVFRDCDFREADFSIIDSTLPDTATCAMFIRCDLRGTRWSRRALDGSHLFECKLHGAHGTPISIRSLEIVRPDLSESGDRSRVGSARDVVEMLRCGG